jgi:hypothetical protein
MMRGMSSRGGRGGANRMMLDMVPQSAARPVDEEMMCARMKTNSFSDAIFDASESESAPQRKKKKAKKAESTI